MTREQWDKLDGKSRWDTIVALRGPDVKKSSLIKWFTSSVIRFAVSDFMRVGGLVNQDLKLVVVRWGEPSFHGPKSTDNSSVWDGEHFFSHISEAAHVLKIPVLGLPGKVWLEGINTGDCAKCVKAWLEGLGQLGNEPSYPPSHYTTHITELERHLKYVTGMGILP